MAQPDAVLGYKLESNEEVLLNIKPSKSSALYFLLAKCGRGILIFFALGVLLYFDYGANSIIKPLMHFCNKLFDSLHYELIPIIIVLLAGLYYWLRMTINGYDYVITNHRIIVCFGFITKNTRIIPYRQLNDINSQASLLERFFGLETIYLDTVSNSLNLNRRRSGNNSTRLEGLTPTVSQEAMEIMSKYLVSAKS